MNESNPTIPADLAAMYSEVVRSLYTLLSFEPTDELFDTMRDGVRERRVVQRAQELGTRYLGWPTVERWLGEPEG